MNDRIAKLQLRIRALHRGHAASQVRYPEDLSARRSSPSLVPARPPAAPFIDWRERSACQPPR